MNIFTSFPIISIYIEICPDLGELEAYSYKSYRLPNCPFDIKWHCIACLTCSPNAQIDFAHRFTCTRCTESRLITCEIHTAVVILNCIDTRVDSRYRKIGYVQFYSKHVSCETSTGGDDDNENSHNDNKQQRQQAKTATTTKTTTKSCYDRPYNNNLLRLFISCYLAVGYVSQDHSTIRGRLIAYPCFYIWDDNHPVSFFGLNGWLLFGCVFAGIDAFVDCFRLVSRDENEFHVGEATWAPWIRFSGCCESGFTFHCCLSIDDLTSH